MADSAKTKYSRVVSPRWRDEYKRDTRFWDNRNEYNLAAELYHRLDELKEAKHSNCYWGEDGGMYQSWHDHWDYLSKIVNMWHAAADPEDPRPNLKSTFAYNAVETAMTELFDLNLMPAVVPWTKKGEQLADIAENILKYPILRYRLNDVWLDAFQEALWLGNSFIKVTYSKIVRKVKLKKLKNFSKKELKKLEKDGDIAIYQDKEIVEHNDIDWIHISPYEYYPDAFARTQHGRSFAAQDGILERNMSYDAFLAEYGNRRGFVNIDKVKPGDSYGEWNENPLFDFPKHLEGTDNVIVSEWESKAKDRVRYCANGVFIGEMPLPNHKQLSVIHLKANTLPHQYYGMGLADVLENLQTEDEISRNKFVELFNLVTSPPIIAGSGVASEFKEQYDVTKYNTGEIISISGSPKEIQWMQPAISKLADFMNLRASIKEDVISVSLIDPKASAMPTNSPTAFEAMSLQAATMKSFAKLLKMFSRSISWGLKLQWALQKQEYPLQMTPEEMEKKKGDEAVDTTKMKSREIFTKDLQIIDEKGRISTKKTPGSSFPLEIKDEYLDLDDDDMDIIIDPESQVPMSKVAKMRKDEEAMAQLMPIFQAGYQDPRIYEDPRIMTLLKNYVYSHNLDEDLLGSEDEPEEDQVDRAIKEEEAMWKNAKLPPDSEKIKPVLGNFEEPLAHRNQHAKRIAGIDMLIKDKLSMIAEKQASMETMMLGGMPGMDMGMNMGGGMGMQAGMDIGANLRIQAEIMNIQADVDTLQRFLDQMREHLAMNKITEQQAVEQALAPQTGMEPGQMSVPMPGEGPIPSEVSGQMPQAAPQSMGSMPAVPAPTSTSTADLQQQQML